MNAFHLASFRFLALALAGMGAVAGPAARAGQQVDVGVSIGVPFRHGYAVVSVGPERYYYHRGVFYRPGRHGYVVVRAPRGAIVRELPPFHSRVYVGNAVYYRYGDVFYQPCPEGFVVVDSPLVVTIPPSTAVVRQAPPATASAAAAPPAPAAPVGDDFQTVWVGDVQYQFRDGQFFKKTADGLVWAEAPVGAITKTLPPDARSVWYQDIEYFECDDVYFRKTPEGYKVVLAPWKK
jgi:hypothetical protein